TAGSDAIRQGSCSSDDERATHAITLRADLLRLVDFLLLVQKCDEGRSVFLDTARSVQRAHQSLELLHIVRILKTEVREVDSGRLRHPIKRIHHQYGIPLGGNTLADVPHRRTHAKSIRPHNE